MKTIIRSLAVASLLSTVAAFPAHTAPIVYNLNDQIQGGRINGSITTDGTLGSVAAGNITSFNLLLRDLRAGSMFGQTNANATVTLLGAGFTATSSGLFFNLGATDGSLLRFAPNGATSDDNTFCVSSVNQVCFANFDQGSQFNLRLTGDSYGAYGLRNEQFATAAPIQSAVPEPLSWAMMIAGFGMVGFAMRRRQKVSTTVRFA